MAHRSGLTMEVGEIKIAEDSDFQHFRKIIDNHEDWEMNYSRDDTKVWTKSVPGIEFKMVKVSDPITMHNHIL